MYFIEQSADIFALFLLTSFTLSLFAKWHWFFGLFAQFTLQYFYGSLILLCVHLALGSLYWCLVLSLIAVITFMRVKKNMTRAHKAPDATHKFSLALHNKYYYNTRYDKLYASLKASDVVILVEAIDNDMEHLKLRFHDTHPFTLPENAKRPDFVLPISKYKIENLVYQNLTDGERPTQGIRFNVRPNDCVDQVTIYTFHAEAPMDGKKSKTQKTQMDSMAQWIKKDTAENNWKNVICAGDWNITPFAPIYDDFLSVTGLKYQVSGVFPVCTWPSFLLFKIFKIPLDHILIDGNLTFVDLKKDGSNGSDHHSLIAHFNVKT